MVRRSKKREYRSPNREQLRRDKDVIVHHRSTREPVPFVSLFSVREGVSTLEILRGGEKDSERHERNEGK